MRWLLGKDLLILGRSRLLLGLLVVYPIAIALLIGFAISRSPSKPRVAIVDETPAGETIRVGDQHVSVGEYAKQVFDQRRCGARRLTREQAIEQIKSGQVLAAVVIPSDIAARISSDVEPGDARSSLQRQRARAVARAVEPGIGARAGEPRLLRTDPAGGGEGDRVTAARAGTSAASGRPSDLIGLREIPRSLQSIIARTPAGSRAREAGTDQHVRRRSPPRTSRRPGPCSRRSASRSRSTRSCHGRRTPLNTFAVVVAVSISLMFVCVLQAAGGLALEREENTLCPSAPRPGLPREAAGREGAARRGVLVRARLRDARGRRRVRHARLEPRRAVDASRSRSARSRSARSGWRSARSPARCGPRHCSRSCSRCRSRCSPSSPRVRSPARSWA